jgi:hypothetical protein
VIAPNQRVEVGSRGRRGRFDPHKGNGGQRETGKTALQRYDGHGNLPDFSLLAKKMNQF